MLLSYTMRVCLSFCLTACSCVCTHITLSLACLTVRDICPVCRTFFYNSLLLSKHDLCHSLHIGRLESAEESHVDGGNCHYHIWNLLGA